MAFSYHLALGPILSYEHVMMRIYTQTSSNFPRDAFIALHYYFFIICDFERALAKPQNQDNNII